METTMAATSILQVLGIQNQEDTITNLLAYAFNASDVFRAAFLRAVCGTEANVYTKCEAHTRVSTRGKGVPDLVLVCHGSDRTDWVVLENKLRAEEGKDQTEKYSSPECIAQLRNKRGLGLTEAAGEPSFVFLTLFPDQEPSETKFSKATYADLLRELEGVSNIADPLAAQLIADWRNLLREFYSHSRIDEADNVSDRLSDESGLDGGYLYFKSLIRSLSLPRGLTVTKTYRTSRQGRHFYGGIISKPSWHPDRMKLNSGKWQLNPSACFNIHFEPQYDTINGEFKLLLHYEVNPYKPKKWVEKNVDSRDYRRYEQRRADFIKRLRSFKIKGLRIGGKSNQIAKAAFDFGGKTCGEVQSVTEGFIGEMTGHIDRSLATIE